MTTLTEQDFRVRSDEALEQARRTLLPLSDQEGFEVEFSEGTLNLLFDEPSEARFVVSPNAPVRQIWVSAMAKGYKLSWEPEAQAFALNGETLPQLLDRLTRQFLSRSGCRESFSLNLVTNDSRHRFQKMKSVSSADRAGR